MLIGRYTAVLDACVMHPAFLKASLLWFASDRLFQPAWSPKIMEEYTRSLSRRFNDKEEQLKRSVAAMNEAFPNASIETPANLEAGIILPDEDDRHVVATALVANADAIITYNIKDFPNEVMEGLDVEVIHPDDFLVNVIDLHPARAIAACRKHREILKDPPYSVEEFAERFERSNLIQTAQRILEIKDLL